MTAAAHTYVIKPQADKQALMHTNERPEAMGQKFERIPIRINSLEFLCFSSQYINCTVERLLDFRSRQRGTNYTHHFIIIILTGHYISNIYQILFTKDNLSLVSNFYKYNTH